MCSCLSKTCPCDTLPSTAQAPLAPIGAHAIATNARNPSRRHPCTIKNTLSCDFQPLLTLRKHITQLGDLFSASSCSPRAVTITTGKGDGDGPRQEPDHKQDHHELTLRRPSVRYICISAEDTFRPPVCLRPTPGPPSLSGTTFFISLDIVPSPISFRLWFWLPLSGPGSHSRFCHVFRYFPLREIPCTPDTADTADT